MARHTALTNRQTSVPVRSTPHTVICSSSCVGLGWSQGLLKSWPDCVSVIHDSDHPKKNPELVFGILPPGLLMLETMKTVLHKLISKNWNHASGGYSCQSLGTEAWVQIGIPWLPQRGPIETSFQNPTKPNLNNIFLIIQPIRGY